jgi:hypothetical protein
LKAYFYIVANTRADINILFFISLSNDLSEIFGDPPERAHFMSEK